MVQLRVYTKVNQDQMLIGALCCVGPPPFSHAWPPFGVVGQPPESLVLGSISWTAGFIASFSDPSTVKQERKKRKQKNYNSSSTLYIHHTNLFFSCSSIPLAFFFFLLFFILKFSHSLPLSLSYSEFLLRRVF
jgi:hypothetical protein